MMTSAILNKLTDVFRDTFESDDLKIDGLTSEDIEAWDSLGHIRLMTALEDAFGVRFSINEIETLKSVNKIVEVIEARVS